MRVLLAGVGLLALVSCTTPDTVTLVQGLGDRPPTVTVEGSQDTRVLTVPLESATLRGRGVQVETRTPGEVRALFGTVLDATPTPTRTYVIQFATGASTIPLEADDTVAALFADVAATPVVEVAIVGHTDRQGSVEVNDRLSIDRAVAVREALIARGLKATLIRVVGRGEREPAVATADEVAEPRNRRVVILVR